MLSVQVRTFGFLGGQAVPAVLEADLSPGSPGVIIQGLPEADTTALRNGVMSAVAACSLGLPRKLTVRVRSAADRGGPYLGLPIAVAALAAAGALPPEPLATCAIFGGVEPDGTVVECEGMAAAAIQAMAHGLALMCPEEQAQAAEHGAVYGVSSLLAAMNHFRGTQRAGPASGLAETAAMWPPERDPVPVAIRASQPLGGWWRRLTSTFAAPTAEPERQGLVAAGFGLPSGRLGFAEALDAGLRTEVATGAGTAVRPTEADADVALPGSLPFPSVGPHGHRARMREKVLERTASALADYEVLEMLLFLAFKRGDTKPLAKKAINRFGSFGAVLSATDRELFEMPGFGEHAVSAIKIVREAALRMVKAEVMDRPLLNNWDRLMDYLTAVLARERVEQFRVLFLDTRNRLLGDEAQARGTVNHTPVYPREVVKRALELQATALILVHNHPSGDPTPSRDDIEMTREVRQAAGVLNIVLHDHVIIGNGRWLSFRREGLL